MQNNLFFEMLPLLAFFAVYYITKNIFLATGVCIAASWLQLLLCQLKYKMITKKMWFSTILITLFGGLTIAFHNNTFVMLKPTVLFCLIGISMIIGQYMGKNAIQMTLSKELVLPAKVWSTLNFAWGLFFIVLGILNLFIAFNFSEYTWVQFKVFGSMGLMFAFMIASAIAIVLYKRRNPF